VCSIAVGPKVKEREIVLYTASKEGKIREWTVLKLECMFDFKGIDLPNTSRGR